MIVSCPPELTPADRDFKLAYGEVVAIVYHAVLNQPPDPVKPQTDER